ncbi:ABC transporter ATP-binding protein [Nocardioides sp.]|uniref:ABC transporter ATP-binding protein n=1 Tax=Nocardioides sp. TaxID=35761 RepID=UPI00273549DC|nr:ABC transporter ATP-binding protein [Nocardioides sp.]MDP3891424.1 ABC transporter ATP-binding protein [Nocardioides sp.]
MTRDLLPIATRRETAALASRLMARHRGALVLAVLSFAVAGACGLVAPWVLGQVVDVVAEGGDESVVGRSAALIAGAAVLGAVFLRLALSFLARAGEPALAGLREQVVATTVHLDSGTVERAGTGDLVSRVGDDVRTVTTALSQVVPLLVSSVVAIAFTTVGLLALDWRLALAGLTAAPLYAAALRWYLPRSGPYYARERVAQGERAEALVGGLRGAPTLRAFGREEHQLDHIATTSWGAARISLDVYRLLTRYFSRNNGSEMVGLGLILATGFVLVRSDLTTVGAVTAAALYFHRLFNPIGALMMLFDEVQSTGASLARLAGIAGIEQPVQPPPVDPAPIDPARIDPARIDPAPAGPVTTGDLVVDGVSHEYVPGRPVLAPTHLRIAPGERVALVGATGAGKTTLGSIVAGVLEPTHGVVRLAEASYAALGPRAVRARVTLVSQDVHVFAGTVRDALTLAGPDATDDDLHEALGEVGAEAWLAQLPDGLATVVGDGGHPLSPAQAQQLALARVLLADPGFVVLDEATAEAGSAGARELEQAALAVTRGRGALVVAHRLTQSQSADRVLVMHDGRVVEEGTHEALVAAGGRYAALWRAWSGG